MIKKIKTLIKNKERKGLIENFLSLSSLQIIGMVLPLITLPYLLRVLGISNYGVIVLASSLVAYFNSITDYSFRITATRDVVFFRNSQAKLNLIYSKVFYVKILLLSLSCSLIILIVLLYPPFYKEKTIYFLSMLMLIGYTLFPEWFFQGIEKMKYITFLNLGVKLVFTIGVFVFIKNKEDYWIYPLLQSLGFIVSGLVAQIILIKKYKLRLVWLKNKMVLNTINSNFPIFLNQFFPSLYNNTTTFLLGVITNSATLGVYDAIKKVVDLCIVLIDTVSRVFFPFLNRRKDAFFKYKKINLIISSSLAVSIIILHQLIFWYLNIGYEHAFSVICVLAIGIIGYALYDVFGLNFFLIRREDSLVMRNTVLSSTIGLTLAFPLIYFFGIIGAAVNLTFARFLMGGLLFFKWRRYDKA